MCRYVPKESDQIDQALAKFINTYTEKHKMKIMFLRESEGVYQFGSKKVHIKVEKGNQVFVRVGAGFMHVRDFITEYTPAEANRIERNDSITRFNRKTSI